MPSKLQLPEGLNSRVENTVAGYALVVPSSKSSFRQLKGSQASQFSLSMVSLYKY
jgi:hypothetical protein